MVLKLIPFHFPFLNVAIRKQNHLCGSHYVSPDRHSSRQMMTMSDFKVCLLKTEEALWYFSYIGINQEKLSAISYYFKKTSTSKYFSMCKGAVSSCRTKGCGVKRPGLKRASTGHESGPSELHESASARSLGRYK